MVLSTPIFYFLDDEKCGLSLMAYITTLDWSLPVTTESWGSIKVPHVAMFPSFSPGVANISPVESISPAAAVAPVVADQAQKVEQSAPTIVEAKVPAPSASAPQNATPQPTVAPTPVPDQSSSPQPQPTPEAQSEPVQLEYVLYSQPEQPALTSVSPRTSLTSRLFTPVCRIVFQLVLFIVALAYMPVPLAIAVCVLWWLAGYSDM